MQGAWKEAATTDVKSGVSLTASEPDVRAADGGLPVQDPRGDVSAFEQVLRTHDNQMRALAYRMLGDRFAMEDALQDAYLRAYRALPRFRGEAKMSTWLYRIVTSACLDRLRRNKRAFDVELTDSIVAAHARDVIGFDDDERLDRADSVRAALEGLGPDQRAAVVLVDVQGLPHDIAASVLGIPVGTLASRLSRARSSLRTALAEVPR